MGELFRQARPKTPMVCTGERLVTGRPGGTEAEHFHRYLLARDLCRGKDVLDVASGEGYGSAFLAQTARSVVGIEVDQQSVEHASSEYGSESLRFIQGDATNLPLQPNSFDVVVSFETIEHFYDHAGFLAEVKRVLRPGGFLLASTPDTTIYSAAGTQPNPYHVLEMTEAEFRQKLADVFRQVSLFRQRSFAGSVILPDAVNIRTDDLSFFEQRDSTSFESDKKLLRSPFLIALASDQEMPQIGLSLYVQGENLAADIPLEVTAELERLHALEETVRDQAPAVAKAISDASALPALQTELDRLHNVEDMARQQGVALSATTRTTETLQSELRNAQDQLAALRAERDRIQDEMSAVLAQLTASQSMARQQTLTSQRLMMELLALTQELESRRQELDSRRQELDSRGQELDSLRHEQDSLQRELENLRRELENLRRELDSWKAAYNEATSLLIPWRVRRALPETLKQPLRAIKRAARSISNRTT